MSADIHCTLTASVVTDWEPKRPESGGKEFHELKVRLDDREWNGKRYSGRDVSVKSYDRADYLPKVNTGDRVFITGTVQAQGYTSKKTGKAGAYNVVVAKTISREWQRAEPSEPSEPKEDSSYPAAANARMAQPSLPGGSQPEEDDVPF
jgi:hypothetical protein